MTETPEPFTLDKFLRNYVYTDGIQADDPGDGAADALSVILGTAVDSLLRVHATTGIDLTVWDDLLPLITLMYPRIVLEGTGETTEHQVASPAGETGRYWLDGDTSKPCNEDAWGAYPTQFSPNLGRTR